MATSTSTHQPAARPAAVAGWRLRGAVLSARNPVDATARCGSVTRSSAQRRRRCSGSDKDLAGLHVPRRHHRLVRPWTRSAYKPHTSTRLHSSSRTHHARPLLRRRRCIRSKKFKGCAPLRRRVNKETERPAPSGFGYCGEQTAKSCAPFVAAGPRCHNPNRLLLRATDIKVGCTGAYDQRPPQDPGWVRTHP
jgi:hypothetical protein